MFLYLTCRKKCPIKQNYGIELNVRNYQYKIIFMNLIADTNMTYHM